MATLVERDKSTISQHIKNSHPLILFLQNKKYKNNK
jgi:hypothetical protein